MIRNELDFKFTETDFKSLGMGDGKLFLKHILDAPEEMNGSGRIFAHACLPAGAWVGPHEHQGEREIYYYLKGEGEYYDDGQIVRVVPGSMTQVLPGKKHGLKNTGSDPLEYICLVLYEREA